jgi:hypothetical protein
MDLIDIDGANANQFRFIISDRERRSLWFSHIITALEELVADIKCAHSRNVNVERRSNVKQIREITAYLLRNNKKGDILKEIDTYLYWFRFKNGMDGENGIDNGVLDMNQDLYNIAILTKLNEIEEKGVDDNTKEFFNMFEMSGDLVYSFRLKEDISNMLSRDAGVHSLSICDMKISVDTMYTPREFFSKLPKDFPHWFIDGKYNVAMSTGFREE